MQYVADHSLACADRLELLRAVHGEILVPDAVFDELIVAGAGEPGASEMAQAAWIKCRPALNAPLVSALSLERDAAEAQAIALAVESRADLILLDERRGRRAAKRLGLTVTGTLGVLIAAKDRGLFAAVRSVLDALRANAGFWIDAILYNAALAAANEQRIRVGRLIGESSRPRTASAASLCRL